MRPITHLIIHHAAVEQTDIGKLISSVGRSHRKRIGQPADKNWSTIAYHYVIWVNGETVQSRDLASIGWHASNRHINNVSIWVMLSGNLDKRPPTDAQYNALNKLIKKYSDLEVHLHNEYAHKTCPWKLFDTRRVLSFNNALMWFYEKLYKKEIEAKGKNKKFQNPQRFIDAMKWKSQEEILKELVFLMWIIVNR